MEFLVDSFAFMLHQVLTDNPEIFITMDMLKELGIEFVEVPVEEVEAEKVEEDDKTIGFKK